MIEKLALTIQDSDEAQTLPIKDVLTQIKQPWQPMVAESEDTSFESGDLPYRPVLNYNTSSHGPILTTSPYRT